jgi:hypothetical protein
MPLTLEHVLLDADDCLLHKQHHDHKGILSCPHLALCLCGLSYAFTSGRSSCVLLCLGNKLASKLLCYCADHKAMHGWLCSQRSHKDLATIYKRVHVNI